MSTEIDTILQESINAIKDPDLGNELLVYVKGLQEHIRLLERALSLVEEAERAVILAMAADEKYFPAETRGTDAYLGRFAPYHKEMER